MKINVVGTSGVGKSTLARRIARQLALPCIEMDRLYWLPQWQGMPDEAFFAKLAAATAAPGWVLDGNYNRSRQIKWRDVDLVVWLDYGFCRTLRQAVCRAAARASRHQELWPVPATAKASVAPFLAANPLSGGPSKPGVTIASATLPIWPTRPGSISALCACVTGVRRRIFSAS